MQAAVPARCELARRPESERRAIATGNPVCHPRRHAERYQASVLKSVDGERMGVSPSGDPYIGLRPSPCRSRPFGNCIRIAALLTKSLRAHPIDLVLVIQLRSALYMYHKAYSYF